MATTDLMASVSSQFTQLTLENIQLRISILEKTLEEFSEKLDRVNYEIEFGQYTGTGEATEELLLEMGLNLDMLESSPTFVLPSTEPPSINQIYKIKTV